MNIHRLTAVMIAASTVYAFNRGDTPSHRNIAPVK